MGTVAPLPWYRDVPSLLSLAQTEQTIGWLENQLPHRRASNMGDTEADTGEQFRCVSVEAKSRMHRWLADGSRVYAGELHGVLEPPQQFRITEAVGDRHPNPEHLRGLDWFIGRMKDEGAMVIAYTPPVNPRVLEDPKQPPAIRASGAAVRVVTERHGVDYCDLGLEAAAIGCGPADFADEVHLSRRCDQHIVRKLADGCAPRAGERLRATLSLEVFR
jgi:hypothetical protein